MADTKPDTRVEDAKAFYKLVVQAEAAQRKRELEAKKFHAGDQWPEFIKTQRAGSPLGSPGAVAARPCLTINQVKSPTDQVVNAIKAARLAVKLAPKGGGATEKLAEIREGLVRAIQVDSRASMARNWAAESAAICGRGYYRIHKEYANDGDQDQDITIKRILNQSSVYLDPFAEEPDWSDGERAIITTDLPLDRYKTRYPKSKISRMTPDELQEQSNLEMTSLGDQIPPWVRQDTTLGWVVRLGEYFYVSYEGKERIVDWCLVSCTEVLDETRWDGRYIPIIPVIGNEYNIGGVRKWDGIVNESAQDANRGFNYMYSAEMEAVGLAPRAPYQLDPRQIEGYEAFWAQSNTRNFPYLPFRRFIDGQDYGQPQRDVAEPAIQAIAMSLHQSKDNINLTTGVPPVALGNLDPHERSGKAIRALQQVSDQGSSNYMDSLASISMTLEGKMLNDLLGKVYDRPGRVVRILDIDEKPTEVMLNQPHVQGPQGQPMPLDQAKKVNPNLTAEDVLHYDMTVGEFSVVPEVGKAFNTRREEGMQAMSAIIEAAPPLTPIIAPYMIGDMDVPHAQVISEQLKKMWPPQLQEGNEDQVKQQAAQDRQRMIQLDQMAQMQHQVITQLQEEKAAKTAELQSKERIAQEDNLTKIRIAEIQTKSKEALAQGEALAERLEQLTGLAHERLTQMHDHAHELGMAAHAHGQGLEAGDVAHQQALEQGEQGHAQTLEAQEQAAALQPEPEPAGAA